MSKVRQIMKLYTQGMGKKRIAQRLSISKNTVRLYLAAIHRLQTPWDELQKRSDFELNQLLHPPEQVLVESKVTQLLEFYPEMEKQLRKRGMTVARQYREFKALHPDALGETTFYKYYNQWKKKVYPSMHIEHKVGDKMYVDYAGATLPWIFR